MTSDTEQDAAVKLEKERAEIVAKYDKGKEATVEPWEDTNFDLYKVVDRFGFVHKNELPSSDSVEEKQKHTEVERTSKWLKMLKSWDKYKNSDKLVRRIYKGIPLQLRGEVWCLLFPGSSSETEGQSQRTLPRRPTDRLGRESNLEWNTDDLVLERPFFKDQIHRGTNQSRCPRVCAQRYQEVELLVDLVGWTPLMTETSGTAAVCP